MKVPYKISLALVVTLITTVSCQKEVDNIRYPEFKLKLVISGYLVPDETIHHILIGSNHHIYGNVFKDEDIGNVTGTISDGNNEILLRPFFSRSNYNFLDTIPSNDTVFSGFVFTNSEMPVAEGKTYTLKVKSDYGLYVEARCTVPLKGETELEIDTSRIENYNQRPVDGIYLNTGISFTDPTGENNYYILLCLEVAYISKWGAAAFNIPIAISDKEYFDDKGKDGLRLRIPLQVIGVGREVDSSYLKIYLLNIDKNYYNYHKSLANYKSGDDPFTETSPVYSNISGGLGIFAAYTIDSMIFRMK
jgi:hypothetical protein